MSSPPRLLSPAPKALIFDLMGTCSDWKSSVVPSLNSAPALSILPPEKLPQLAADWRAGFFTDIHSRFQAKQEAEDIDATHRRVLDQLLEERGIGLQEWDEGVRKGLVDSWHVQKAWPDALDAIARLKQEFLVVVLANGTTRLQLDIVQSSGLPFHTLFSSELLGMTKPDPEIYLRALDLLQLNPSECAMIAAHAYDLAAAKSTGMKTVYVQRTTEDLDLDKKRVRGDVDLFIDGSNGKMEGGLGELADLLGA